MRSEDLSRSGFSRGSPGSASVQIGWALRRYRRETLRLIAEIGMGTGAMAVLGGTVAIIGFVTLSGGSLIAIQGFASLGNIGVEAFTGFFAALANTRIAAPIVAGVALAATVGAGATAQLGAMRISEEIDALEVMGIKSISYLVSTRILARTGGDRAAVRAGDRSWRFTSGQVVTTVFYGQSNGTYKHYFRTFLRPEDVGWSFVQAVVMALIVMISHCYYGYTASGGPVGVGQAVGRSMRFSLVCCGARCPAGLVGALRRRSELQPHGVAAMTHRRARTRAAAPYRRACVLLLVVCSGSRVGVRAVSRGFHPEDRADDGGHAGRTGDGAGVEGHLQRGGDRPGGQHLEISPTASRRRSCC